MLRSGSLLDPKWYHTKFGLEVLSSFQHSDGSRKTFGLLEQPSLPPTVSLEEVRYKVLLVGKSGVGKTATAANLTGHSLPESHYETAGIQVWQSYWPARIRQLNKVVVFNLHFWESGETVTRKFDHILPACREDIDCILFLFSLLDKTSFDELPQMISRLTEPSDNICRIAIGTKFDQFDQSEITQKDIQCFEQQWDIPVLKIQNLTDSNRQGRESSSKADLILTSICCTGDVHSKLTEQCNQRETEIFEEESATHAIEVRRRVYPPSVPNKLTVIKIFTQWMCHSQ